MWWGELVALTEKSRWHNCGVDERGLVMNSRSHGDRINLRSAWRRIRGIWWSSKEVERSGFGGFWS